MQLQFGIFLWQHEGMSQTIRWKAVARDLNPMITFAICALLIMSTSWAARPEWIELETNSFRALSQIREGKSRAILNDLQVFQSALASMINVPTAQPRVPTQIFLLGKEEFRRATQGRGDIAGVFVAQPFRNDIVIDASKPTTLSLFAIYHEYVHFNLRNNGHATLPAFYEEGLAQLVQYFEIRGRQYHFGYFPQGMWNSAYSAKMPLDRVLAVDTRSDDYRSHQFQAPFYARSLLLLHYCTIGNPNSHVPLARFTTRLSNGDEMETAFNEEFGISPATLDRELDGYIRRATELHAIVSADTLPKPPAPRLKQISEADAKLEFGTLLLRMSGDMEGVDAWLTPALEDRPGDPQALAALAFWHERSGRPAEADSLIARLTAAPDSDATSLTRAGFILLERAQSQPILPDAEEDASALSEKLRPARELFERALQRDPSEMEAAYGYGVTQVMAPEDVQQGLRIIEQAVQRFPESGELRLVQALLLDGTGNDIEARKILALAACRVIDPRMRALAREELGSMRCMKAN